MCVSGLRVLARNGSPVSGEGWQGGSQCFLIRNFGGALVVVSTGGTHAEGRRRARKKGALLGCLLCVASCSGVKAAPPARLYRYGCVLVVMSMSLELSVYLARRQCLVVGMMKLGKPRNVRGPTTPSPLRPPTFGASGTPPYEYRKCHRPFR